MQSVIKNEIWHSEQYNCTVHVQKPSKLSALKCLFRVTLIYNCCGQFTKRIYGIPLKGKFVIRLTVVHSLFAGGLLNRRCDGKTSESIMRASRIYLILAKKVIAGNAEQSVRKSKYGWDEKLVQIVTYGEYESGRSPECIISRLKNNSARTCVHRY